VTAISVTLRQHRLSCALGGRNSSSHLAAYTNVDGCETNPQIAEATNSTGTRNVATALCEGRRDDALPEH